MATSHIESLEEDISELVIMPGDPLRAEYIAKTFLDNVTLVNTVRNMNAYTGFYGDKRITVFPSGMGVPSMGIYAYELFKFYNVKKIIRIGTCGTYNKKIKLMDLILSEGAYSKSFYPELLDGSLVEYVSASEKLNKDILYRAEQTDLPCHLGKTITSDVFDPYCDNREVFEKHFFGDKFLAVEMEAFALFYLAQKFKRDASCLMTVVDSKYDKKKVSREDREKSLNRMIAVALESI